MHSFSFERILSIDQKHKHIIVVCPDAQTFTHSFTYRLSYYYYSSHLYQLKYLKFLHLSMCMIVDSAKNYVPSKYRQASPASGLKFKMTGF